MPALRATRVRLGALQAGIQGAGPVLRMCDVRSTLHNSLKLVRNAQGLEPMSIMRKWTVFMVVSIACGAVLCWTYRTLAAIRVVSSNAAVVWSKDWLSEKLQKCSPSLGLPEDFILQSAPGNPEALVQALGWLPDTLQSATIALGDDPLAPRVTAKIIENKGLRKLLVHGCPISDSLLIEITRLPSLRVLALSGTEQSFHHFSPSSRVLELELDKTRLDLVGLNRVLSVQTLENLSIVENEIEFDSLLKANWNHPSLMTLELGSYNSITDDPIEALVKLIKRGCPKIKAIYINQRDVAKTPSAGG